jgi:hypothetical protein
VDISEENLDVTACSEKLSKLEDGYELHRVC